jgi:hypothetical protein
MQIELSDRELKLIFSLVRGAIRATRRAGEPLDPEELCAAFALEERIIALWEERHKGAFDAFCDQHGQRHE